MTLFDSPINLPDPPPQPEGVAAMLDWLIQKMYESTERLAERDAYFRLPAPMIQTMQKMAAPAEMVRALALKAKLEGGLKDDGRMEELARKLMQDVTTGG
jgi:hypothetical protein